MTADPDDQTANAPTEMDASATAAAPQASGPDSAPTAYSEEPDTVDYDQPWAPAARRSWWIPAGVFAVAAAVAGVIALSIAGTFTGPAPTEPAEAVEQAEPTALPMPATAPNGTYRLTFDLANVTISEDDGTPRPVDSSDRDPVAIWSFTTSCTATECIAAGKSLSGNEQIDSRTITEHSLRHKEDGTWESVKPHLGNPCTDGSEFGSTWMVWTPVSPQAADQYHGVEIGVLRIVPGGGACSSEGGKYRVETPFTATLVGASALPPTPQPSAVPPPAPTVTVTAAPPEPSTSVPPLATPEARIAEPIICSLHNQYPQMQPVDLALSLVDRGIYRGYDDARLVVDLVLADGCHGI